MDIASPLLRTASGAVHILGASVLAYCFAVRSSTRQLSFKNWRQVPRARWYIMLVFFDSWLFHISAGLLIVGSGTSKTEVTCPMAIYLCIIIYCSSKVLIYNFLIERVFVVWPHTGTRLSSKAYCVCLALMSGYAVVVILMFIGRNTFFDSGGRCVIGLKPFASIPLLSYDLFLNVFLTFMFLWPLQQAHFRDARLRKIASRTLLAAVVALTTSTINIAILTIRHGEELGWICLASCGMDVTVNALALYWVTGYRPDDHVVNNPNYLTTINFSMPQSSQPGVTTSIHTNMHVAVPAPVQDMTKPRRHAPGMSSRASDERMTGDSQTHARHWSGVQRRSMDDPLEGMAGEREPASVAWIPDGSIGAALWRVLRQERFRPRTPCEVRVTSVHEAPRLSYGSERRYSGGTDRKPDVCE